MHICQVFTLVRADGRGEEVYFLFHVFACVGITLGPITYWSVFQVSPPPHPSYHTQHMEECLSE